MKMKCKKKITPIVVSAAALIALASCGKVTGLEKSLQPIQQKKQNLVNEGTYEAILTGVNTSVSGSTNGIASVSLSGDSVIFQVQVAGAPVAMHAQHIHTGTSCAGEDADTNGDGFVDATEASEISGDILIPLDADVNSQEAGADSFENGANYTYEQTGSLIEMINDLTSPDENPNDDVVKLPSGSTDVDFEGKVIEIHGVAANTNLPGTVKNTDSSKSPQEELPIACGVLRKVSDGNTGGSTTGGTTGETTGGSSGTTTGDTTGGTVTGGKGGGGSAEPLPGDVEDTTMISF